MPPPPMRPCLKCDVPLQGIVVKRAFGEPPDIRWEHLGVPAVDHEPYPADQ